MFLRSIHKHKYTNKQITQDNDMALSISILPLIMMLDWTSYLHTRRSTIRECIYLGNARVLEVQETKSGLQILHGSRISAMFSAYFEIVCLRRILSELGFI